MWRRLGELDRDDCACGYDNAGRPVAAAEAQVTTAQGNLDTANGSLTSAQKQLCSDASDYVAVLDRYGKLFTPDSKATVGDVKTGGADLTAPKEAVTTSATAVDAAQGDVTRRPSRTWLTRKRALAAAQSAAGSAGATTAAPPTTTTLVPPATITRVKQAEADFQTTTAGINDSTPLLQATAAFNSAAFALEVAWSKLLLDANCLTDVQEAEAVKQITAYSVELQTDLATRLQTSGRRHLRPDHPCSGRAAADRQRPPCHGLRRPGHRCSRSRRSSRRRACRPPRSRVS